MKKQKNSLPAATANTGSTLDRQATSTPDHNAIENVTPKTSKNSRRAFLGQAAVVTVAASVVGVPLSSSNSHTASAQKIVPVPDGCERGPLMSVARADEARRLRVAAADYERNMPIPSHPCNGDESTYANRNYFASYTKGLPHPNPYGEVDSNAYKIYLEALNSGKPQAFEEIPLGCGASGAISTEESRLAPDATTPGQQRRLQNPQAGYNFDLEGKDYHQLISRQGFIRPRTAFPPAFNFNTPDEAVEIVENYWQALTRDIPFLNYESDTLVAEAAADLNQFAEYRGPRENGQVTPRLYSRGVLPGDNVGPYVSQFLLRDVPYGAQTIDARIRTAEATKANEFLTEFYEWRTIQDGCTAERRTTFAPTPLYIRSGRDLAEYVRNDAIYQAYLNAALIMLAPTSVGGLGTPLDPNNPYLGYRTQDNFVEFGISQLLTLLGEVSVRAHKAVWYQKWQVHRRLRPEEFGGRVHFWLTDRIASQRYPINPVINNSSVLRRIGDIYNGNFFLPQAFPEASPVHPAYGAGHATLAGACVTILKAWFDETSNPFVQARGAFVASADGTTRLPYGRLDRSLMSIGGELNKLASNVSIGRNIAGVHWRSDYTESVYLGEQVAIQLLEDYGFTYNEDFAGFTFTDFDGNNRVVGARRTS